MVVGGGGVAQGARSFSQVQLLPCSPLLSSAPPYLAPYSHLFSFCVFLLPHLFLI